MLVSVLSVAVVAVRVPSNPVAKIKQRPITPSPGFRLHISVAANPEILVVRGEVQHKIVLIFGVYGCQVSSPVETISPGIVPAQLYVRVKVAGAGGWETNPMFRGTSKQC